MAVQRFRAVLQKGEGGGHLLEVIGDGDEVELELEPDDAPREVEVPLVFTEAVETGGLRDDFDALSFAHRKEYVRWIEEAKRDETRGLRLAKAAEMLGDGVKTPG